MLENFYRKLNRYALYAGMMLLMCAGRSLAAGSGTIRGRILDKETKSALPGANVLVKGTNIGAATDLNGNFVINNAPAGEQTLIVSYVGYRQTSITVNVPSDAQIEKTIYLEPTAIKGKTVIVTAQAVGQLQSINQELSSNKIVNVVSSEKMKELPDANIAESIGRLPGVSLQRFNGQADAVIIRGMAPKYNLVEIQGVPMSSTYWGDRGVDLSLLSDQLISGVTVSKTLSASMDPNALGGTVDMTLKTAEPGWHYSFWGNGGYTHLDKSLNNYKLSGSVGNRFADNKIGVLALADIDQQQLPSQQFSASYQDGPAAKYVNTYSTDLIDQRVTERRYGISLILDYASNFVDVKFFNVYDQKNDSTLQRNNNTLFQSNQFQDQVFSNQTKAVQETHSIQALFKFAGTQLPVSLSYFKGEMREPNAYEFDFYQTAVPTAPQPAQWIYGRPLSLINEMGVLDPTNSNSTFYNMVRSNTALTSDNYEAKADWKIPFKFSDSFSGELQVGGMYRSVKRTSSNASDQAYMLFGNGAALRRFMDTSFVNLFPQLSKIPVSATTNMQAGLPAYPFVDPGYTTTNILGYPIGPSWAIPALVQMGNSVFSNPAWKDNIWVEGPQSYNQNYTDKEYTNAGYVMATLNIGDRLTIVPGIRYQEEQTNISAYHIRVNTSNRNGLDGTPPVLVDTKRDNPNWYPSVNVKYKLTDNVNLIGAVYKSESLPSYSEISPLVELQDGTGVLVTGNPLLKPSTAWNFDLGTSVHSNAIGLFTVDVFYKEISNLIYQVPNFYAFYPYPIENAPANLSSLLPARSYYDTTWANNLSRLHIYGSIPMNDPYKAFLRGAEFSWQTNLWYLPGLLSGLVLNLNMSLMSSSELYPSFQTVKTAFGSIDSLKFTTVGGRLQDQPSLVYNAILGWDHQGFSARLSASYQGLTLQSMDTQYGLQDSYYDKVLLIDVSLKQQIVGGLAAFANVTNINNHIDHYYYSHPTFVNGTTTYSSGQLPTSEQTYSWNAQLGLTFSY